MRDNDGDDDDYIGAIDGNQDGNADDDDYDDIDVIH